MSKQDYFSARRVTAWPEAKDGRAGYGVDMWDGNQIWVPEDIFQAEYRPVDGFSFSLALAAMKAGKRVTRQGWQGECILLVEGGERVASFIGEQAKDGAVFPWIANHQDLLANDWTVMLDPPIAAAAEVPAEDAAAA